MQGSTGGVLQVAYPEELLRLVDQAELEQLAREALLVKLYDLGKVSPGRAARILGTTRREFLDVLGRYGVSTLDAGIEGEARVADRRAGRPDRRDAAPAGIVAAGPDGNDNDFWAAAGSWKGHLDVKAFKAHVAAARGSARASVRL